MQTSGVSCRENAKSYRCRMGRAKRLGKNPNLADWENECTIRYDESHLQDRY